MLTGRVLRDIRTRVPTLTWTVPEGRSATGTVEWTAGHAPMRVRVSRQEQMCCVWRGLAGVYARYVPANVQT